MADDDQDGGDVVRQLLTTPPGEFVAERNRLVKVLKKEGDKDAAAAIGALRKPSVADWAFNVLAGEEADEIDDFADAATDVQEAQSAAIEGRAGTDIRDAVRTLRERTAALVARARTVVDKPGIAAAGSSVSELTARLAEIAGSAQATASLRNGLVGAGETDDSDPFGGLDVPARPLRRERSAASKSIPAKGAKAGKAAKAGGRAKASADEKAEADEAAAEQERAEVRRGHMRDLADAERAHGRATKQLDRVETELERVAATAAKAQSAYDDALKKLETAQQQMEEAEARRDKAADAVSAAESAVATAQKAVDADT